jgi:hypothetical protein
MSGVVTFPARRSQRVRGQLGLDRPAGQRRLDEIDEELRTVERMIKTLKRREQGLVTRYRAELRRILKAKEVGA